MMNYQIIKTARLNLIPFTQELISTSYINWLNDPTVVRFSRQRFVNHSYETCLDFLNSFENSNSLFLAIIMDETREHIGNITTQTDMLNKVSDLQILIGPKENWGAGFATEAWQGLMDYLLKYTDIEIITGGCMEENIAMIKIMEKTGMRPYYIREKYFKTKSGRSSSVHFYKTKEKQNFKLKIK